MRWLSVAAQMVIPLGIFIYTINFGRWLSKKRIKSGAYTAYLVGIVSIGITIWVIILSNL